MAWRDRLVLPGDSWAAQLERTISESNIVFVLVSPESEKSQWLATETALAVSESTHGRTRVVPVLLDRRTQPSGLLQTIQGIQLFDPDRSSGQLDALVRAIESDDIQDQGPTRRDLEAVFTQVKSTRAALETELFLHQSTSAVWSATIASAVTVLTALGVILATIVYLADFSRGVIEGWAFPFILGAFTCLSVSFLFVLLRRRFLRRDRHEDTE